MKIHMNEVPAFWKDILAVDCETTNLDPHTGHLLSVAVYDGTDVWLFLHTTGFNKLRHMLEDESILKLFQNAKFDMKWFYKRGWMVKNIYDTMLADSVIESGRMLPMDLSSIAARRVGVYLSKEERSSFMEHPGFDKTPLTEDQQRYMIDDVRYLPLIREEHLSRISKEGLGKVVKVEFDIVPALVELELSGLKLDTKLWFEHLDWYEQEIERTTLQMRSLIGDYILKVPGRKNKQDIVREIPTDEINFNSPKQLYPLLRERFGMPVVSTSKSSLTTAIEVIEDGIIELPEGLSGDAAEFAKLLMNRKKWSKLAGFKYHEFIHPLTGKVHPNFHQMGARTGRFSCTDPNMQQVPRPVKEEPNLRHIWIGDTEQDVIIRADYSQQEPRVMAQLSGDPAMIRACNTEDVYIEFAKEMYGREVEKGSDERQYAKTFVLAVGYGAGPDKLAKASGLPVGECERIKNLIQAKFPVMAGYGRKMFDFLQTYDYVPTALGRKRYIDKAHQIFTEAVNTPVQGTAADMFKIALSNIYSVLTSEKKCGNINPSTRVWNLVHDELEVHAHEDEVDAVYDIIRKGMEEAGSSVTPLVKHIAEINHNKYWTK